MDPILEEICRARGPQDVRPDVFKRWQRYLADVIGPRLEVMDAVDEPLRRGPGRPRKEAIDAR
jgi:hypothetical protein